MGKKGVSVYFDDAEREALKRLCEREGLSISTCVRRIVREKLVRQGVLG